MPGLDSTGRIVDATSLAQELRDRGLGASQVEAIADGQLSLDELMSLTQLEVACVRELGASVNGPTIHAEMYGVEVATYTWAVDPTKIDPDNIEPRVQECTKEFTMAYGMLYRSAESPSIEEQNTRLAAAATGFVKCARTAGDSPPLTSVSVDDLPAFFAWRSHLDSESPSLDCPFEP